MVNNKFSFFSFGVCAMLVFLMSVSSCDKLTGILSGSDDGMTSGSDDSEADFPLPPPSPSPLPPYSPPPSSPPSSPPSIPQSRVWYVAENGSDSNSGIDASSQLASVQAALTRIRSIYRSGNWPVGESAVIMVSGKISGVGSLGTNESLVEITGAGNYPPVILQGDPATGGILDANRAGEDGRVLYITNNTVILGENLTLRGGYQLWGGAVCIGTNGSASEGEFIMAGGEISGNTGASGGAVMIYKGSMVMSGGVIKNNRNDYNTPGSGGGGGIYVYEDTTFTMTGGIIESNGGDSKADKGGGIYIDGKGTATMTGGEIRKNTSIEQGGGVYIGPFGTFTMSGGLITGNQSGEGGGVYTSSLGGTFNKNDGTITGNIPN